jgi:hypothetical protein
MVDITDMKAKEFEDRKMIDPENLPQGEIEIQDALRVTITSGVSMGKEKLVMKLKQGAELYSYFPNKVTIGALAGKFGNNTDAWKGKKITLTTENVMVQNKKKKMIVLA